MEKVDYKKILKEYYGGAINKINLVNVKAMNFLSVKGKGNPNLSEDYKDAI